MSSTWSALYPPRQPQRLPAQSDGISPESKAVGPGLAPRIVFSAAIVIGVLPDITIVPLSGNSQNPLVAIFYLLGLFFAALFRSLVGVFALILVKNATLTRRFVGMGIFFVACLDISILTHMVTMFVDRLPGEARGSIVIVIAITAVIEAIYVALVFVSWNVVRHRRWMICLASIPYALAVVGVGQVADGLFSSIDAPYELSTTLTTLLDLVLMSLGFGLFHLLGRIRGATVPIRKSRPASTGTQRVELIRPINIDPDSYPGYPGA